MPQAAAVETTNSASMAQVCRIQAASTARTSGPVTLTITTRSGRGKSVHILAASSHITCHAAHIAWQLGRPLKWDPAKAEFIGDEEANHMRSRAQREPWRY